MKPTEITLILNRLTSIEKQQLCNWLNENSDFTDWSLKMLNLRNMNYLDTDYFNEYRLSEVVRVGKTIVSYGEFKRIVQSNRD